MITLNNYEEFLMLYIDGELATSEREEFERFMEEHPEVGTELEQYQLVKVAPDMTQHYQAKDGLLKPETRVVPLFNFGRLAAAAALVLLLAVSGVVIWQNNNRLQPEVAKVNVNPVAPIPVQVPQSTDVPQAAAQPVAVDARQNKLQQKAATGTASAGDVTQGNRQYDVAKAIKICPSSATTELYAATMQQMQPLPVRNQADSLLAVAVPALTITPDAGIRQSWLDLLPLDDLKRQQIDELGASLATGYNKAGKIKNIRPELSVSVKLEKKKLILSF